MAVELPRVPTLQEQGAVRHEAKLPNETQVVLYELDHIAPVYIRVLLLNGSMFDPIEGTAHFVEHMVTKGTKNLPDKDRLYSHIRKTGGKMRASTGYMTMEIDAKVPRSRDARVAFELLHEVLFEPLFDPSHMEKERTAIQEERQYYEADPSAMIDTATRQLVYQGTPADRPIEGTKDSIDQINRDDLMSYMQSTFTNDRSIIIGCGNIDFDTFYGLAGEYLPIPQGNGAQIPEALPTYRDEWIRVHQYPGGEQSRVAFGFRTVPLTHPDSAALDILAESLGTEVESRLFKKLRLHEGLVYDVSAYSCGTHLGGYWYISTEMNKDSLQKAMDIVTDEVKRVTDEGLTQEEVEYVQQIRVLQLYDIETTRRWVDSTGHGELSKLRGYTGPDYLQQLLAVTPEMTRDVAQEYFGQNKWYMTLGGELTPDAVNINL